MPVYSDVKVFDKEGNLKKIITAKAIAKKVWKNFNIGSEIFKEQGKRNQKGSKKVKSRKKFPMINCGYLPCNKKIQQIKTRHRFCINPKGSRKISCSEMNKRLLSKKRTEARVALRAAGGIISNCPSCLKDFKEIVKQQKYCRNPCVAMGPHRPIVDITCKLCKKITRAKETRITLFCGKPCNAKLWKAAQYPTPKINKICHLCKKSYKGRAHVKNMYCHDPCDGHLAKKVKRGTA